MPAWDGMLLSVLSVLSVQVSSVWLTGQASRLLCAVHVSIIDRDRTHISVIGQLTGRSWQRHAGQQQVAVIVFAMG